MCGIWFSLGLTPNRDHLDRISHRGPDGEGWREFVTPGAGAPLVLGHRRLAIIDLSDGGAQPKPYADGRYWITFNGEIYNYIELREELRQLGRTFTSESDIEVILAAYDAWGRDCLSRLRGMFAFVLYDTRAQRVLLARDRFGIKPLYYVRTPNGIAAGSEIKQLLDVPGVSTRINGRRAHDFLAAGTLDHSCETMFADVQQLGQGCWAEIDVVSRNFTEGVWYRLPEPDTLDLGGRDAAEQFLALLQDSVRLHLRADVEVGSCLSGGLDSSTLVCLISEQLAAVNGSHQLNAVTARFEGTAVDETRYADVVAAAAGARSHAARPRAEDILAEASTIVWHQDEPYGSTSIHAQHHVFAAARANGLKVMLDGQGADELLAGYHGVYDLRFGQLMREWRLAAGVAFAARRARMFGTPFLPQLAAGAGQMLASAPRLVRTPIHRALHFARARHANGTGATAPGPWLDMPAFGLNEGPYQVFERGIAEAGLPPMQDIASLCVGLTRGNVPMLLHWEDRNSMAHGVEARVPFLDHPLVEFAIRLGGEHKLVNGWTKWVLRESMRGRLPEEVRTRTDKLGFATPEAAWFRGPLRGAMEDAALATVRRFPGQFNTANATTLVRDTLDGRRAFDYTPWRLACFGIWAERFGASF